MTSEDDWFPDDQHTIQGLARTEIAATLRQLARIVRQYTNDSPARDTAFQRMRDLYDWFVLEINKP